jgi:phage repressor protein C with HTH and peptisase S24 domain
LSAKAIIPIIARWSRIGLERAAPLASGCLNLRIRRLSQSRDAGVSMLTHAQVWSAIDRLAARAGLTASGLARRAGLDPTTFNKSKRITAAGRARWPSTESIAKALTATGIPLETFVELIARDSDLTVRAVPLLAVTEAGAGGRFDHNGLAAADDACQEIAFPAVNDEHVYALKISGESMAPAYRDGDIIIVSPSAEPRDGDRVVVRTKAGEVIVKEVKRKTAKSIELRSLDSQHTDRTLAMSDIAWMARILWASQ